MEEHRGAAKSGLDTLHDARTRWATTPMHNSLTQRPVMPNVPFPIITHPHAALAAANFVRVVQLVKVVLCRVFVFILYDFYTL